MMQESRYHAKRAFRTRGHADLVLRVGGVFAEIDERLRRQDVVRVLELGCGFGTVLLELRQRYGPRVVLHGMNRRPRDGDADMLRRNGIERGLIAPGAPASDALPTLAFGDVADGLPFPDASFDLVYSQVAWLYFADKVGVLREVIRVLRADGLAKIDADELRPELPPEYQRLIEVWQDGRLVPFGDYLRRYGMAFEPAAEGEYMRIGKSAHFGEDLQLVFQVHLGEICARWNGIKCVYRVVAG
jgi:SAM-dependent methyltransferase